MSTAMYVSVCMHRHVTIFLDVYISVGLYVCMSACLYISAFLNICQRTSVSTFIVCKSLSAILHVRSKVVRVYTLYVYMSVCLHNTSITLVANISSCAITFTKWRRRWWIRCLDSILRITCK